MHSGTKIALLGTTALLGPMTPIERQHGRYMRAPDHAAAGGDGAGGGKGADAGAGKGAEAGKSGDGGFAEFEAAGDVEVGNTKDAIESNVPEPKGDDEKPKKGGAKAKAAGAAAKPDAAKPDAAKPDAAKPGEGEEGAEEEGDEEEGDEEEEEQPKPKKKASDRIRELTAARRSDRRIIEQLSSRLEAIEKGGLPGGGNRGNAPETDTPAPDPTDTKKYPLGHLDDRYIEDRLEWLADKKAAERADAVLQRQQEIEQGQHTEQTRAALLEKVDNLSTRGSEIFDDFQETVIEAGMRGDWRLEQPTFEAAHEATHGARILYELSQDKKEAARVASLPPYQQMRFVLDRDAEIASKSKGRTKPAAGEPPSTQTKGANSSHRISPATDDLAAFERAWAADAKAH